jgi:malonyl-CoA decarboxylase
LADGEPGLLRPAERQTINAAAGRSGGAKGTLKSLLADPDLYDDQSMIQTLRPPLTRLCARYLLFEKRNSGGALDPVAHFHLSNGARMERLNWLGDRSPRGMGQSAGMMINYLYDLNRIEDNHEAYTADGKIVASPAIRSLAKG